MHHFNTVCCIIYHTCLFYVMYLDTLYKYDKYNIEKKEKYNYI